MNIPVSPTFLIRDGEAYFKPLWSTEFTTVIFFPGKDLKSFWRWIGAI